jgi:hypothetical protein
MAPTSASPLLLQHPQIFFSRRTGKAAIKAHKHDAFAHVFT